MASAGLLSCRLASFYYIHQQLICTSNVVCNYLVLLFDAVGNYFISLTEFRGNGMFSSNHSADVISHDLEMILPHSCLAYIVFMHCCYFLTRMLFKNVMLLSWGERIYLRKSCMICFCRPACFILFDKRHCYFNSDEC